MERYKSLHYSLIFDDIGFSQKHIQRTHALWRKVNDVCRFMKLPGTHATGSWVEGLGPLLVECNMKTDVDLMLVTWEAGINDCRMRVHCSNEYPGFVKLETNNRDLPLARKYGKDFVSSIEFHVAVSSCFSCVMLSHVLKSTFFNTFLEILSEISEFDMDLSHQQGPAFAATFKNPLLLFEGPLIEKCDIVVTVECPDWPSVAMEWVVRKRHFNWPSKSLVDNCVRNGCLLVPVGNKESPDEHIEWRISFSLVERNLFWSLNPTQYKCFAILKCILTYILKPKFEDALTSFIMKNALFWTVEQTDPDLWCPENLIECTKTCLKTIFKWVREDRCPHYIIPGNNILKNRYNANQKEQILYVLENILEDFIGLVESIPPLKQRLYLKKNIRLKIEGISLSNEDDTPQQNECCDLETEPNTLKEKESTTNGLKNDGNENVSILTVGKKNDIALSGDFIIPVTILILIQDLLSYRVMLKVAKCEHLTGAYEWINKNFIYSNVLHLPVIRYFVSKLLSFQMLLILRTRGRSHNKKKYAVLTFLRTVKKIRRAFHFVLEPAPASQIAFMYFYLFRTHTALAILNKLVNLYRSCGYPKHLGFISSNEFKRKTTDMLGKNSTEEMTVLSHYFTIKEMDMMPKEMQFEIVINSLHGNFHMGFPELKSSVFEPFFQVIFWSSKNPTPVDPMVFASYLQFKCYQRLNNTRGKMRAIENLEWFSSHPSSKYKHVSYNLLGYCYFQTGDPQKALAAFCTAMTHSKGQNSPIWHITLILYQLFRQEIRPI